MQLHNLKIRYILCALLDIARNQRHLPVRAEDVSKRQNISLAYLQQLFLKLKRNGLLQSVRGPGGGYVITTETISIYDIIASLGLKGELYNSEEGTSEKRTVDSFLKVAQMELISYLKGRKLSDLL